MYVRWPRFLLSDMNVNPDVTPGRPGNRTICSPSLVNSRSERYAKNHSARTPYTQRVRKPAVNSIRPASTGRMSATGSFLCMPSDRSIKLTSQLALELSTSYPTSDLSTSANWCMRYVLCIHTWFPRVSISKETSVLISLRLTSSGHYPHVSCQSLSR